LDPLQLHTELRTEALEADRREFHTQLSQWEQKQTKRDRRQGLLLMGLAVLVALIIGVLTMTPGSVGYQLISRIISSWR